MKKFLIKTILLLFPFWFLFSLTFVFSVNSESPDVLRIGDLPNIYWNYRNKYQKEISNKIHFDKVSDGNDGEADILTIGDSFSEQSGFGYKNYLAENYNVLHIDRFISKNQIQTLIELVNGDFFKDQSIRYVVLQNVERHFIENTNDLDLSKKIDISNLDSIIANHQNSKFIKNEKFFSKNIFTFPISMFRFFFYDNYLSNGKIYNVKLKTTKLFSNNSNKLLFYYKDLKSVSQNNSVVNVQKLNNTLNDLSYQLKDKGVLLIVLPAPDKYDLYYDYIENKTNYPKPQFFKILDSLEKHYIYIDSKRILTDLLDKTQDVYFYDDTHWSPVASKVISEAIQNRIKCMYNCI